MRDVLIATGILAAGAYGAWSYVPATADAPAQDLAIAEAQAEPSSAPERMAPAADVRAVAGAQDVASPTPLPLDRPSNENNLAVVERTAQVDVLQAGLIELDGEVHSLFGIDAPSVGQTCRNAASGLWACGTDARQAVARFVDGRNVVCEPVVAAVEAEPAVSRCMADGVDVSQWVVANGWAVADTDVDNALVPSQMEARTARKGLWAGWFEAPAEWRARNDDDVQLALRDDNRV